MARVIALTLIALMLWGIGNEVMYLRHDYERVHALPDGSKSRSVESKP